MIELTTWNSRGDTSGRNRVHVAGYRTGEIREDGTPDSTACGRRIPPGAWIWSAEDRQLADACRICTRIVWRTLGQEEL